MRKRYRNGQTVTAKGTAGPRRGEDMRRPKFARRRGKLTAWLKMARIDGPIVAQRAGAGCRVGVSATRDLLTIKDFATMSRIVTAERSHRRFESIRTNCLDQLCAALGIEKGTGNEQVILLTGD